MGVKLNKQRMRKCHRTELCMSPPLVRWVPHSTQMHTTMTKGIPSPRSSDRLAVEPSQRSSSTLAPTVDCPATAAWPASLGPRLRSTAGCPCCCWGSGWGAPCHPIAEGVQARAAWGRGSERPAHWWACPAALPLVAAARESLSWGLRTPARASTGKCTGNLKVSLQFTGKFTIKFTGNLKLSLHFSDKFTGRFTGNLKEVYR